MELSRPLTTLSAASGAPDIKDRSRDGARDQMPASATYRVVGIRANGSMRVLCERIDSEERAKHLANALKTNSPFAEIKVQCDGDAMMQLSSKGTKSVELFPDRLAE